MSTYARVLRVPGGRRLLGFGTLARLGSGMTPLALILATLAAGGGYSRAGLFVGAYGLAGAAAGPFVGRAVDAAGARVMLTATATLHAVALVALSVTLTRSPLGAALLCAGAGATYPPLTAVIRGSWAALGRDDDRAPAELRAPALALDAAAFELVFVLGPVVVSVVAALTEPRDVLWLIAAITLLGTATLLPAGVLVRRPSSRARDRIGVVGVLARPGFVAVVGVSGALGVAFGAVTVAVTAFARAHSGAPTTSGVLLGAWGAGSVLGGLAYAARPPAGRLVPRLGILLALVAVSIGALAAVGSTVAAGVVLVVGGAAIAPTLAVYTLLANLLTPPHAAGEANNWLVSVPVAAQALGGWLAGLAVDDLGGTTTAFAAAAAVVVVSLTWVWWPGRALHRAEWAAGQRPG